MSETIVGYVVTACLKETKTASEQSKAMEGEAVLSGFILVAYLLGRGQKSAWGSGDSSSS